MDATDGPHAANIAIWISTIYLILQGEPVAKYNVKKKHMNDPSTDNL